MCRIVLPSIRLAEFSKICVEFGSFLSVDHPQKLANRVVDDPTTFQARRILAFLVVNLAPFSPVCMRLIAQKICASQQSELIVFHLGNWLAKDPRIPALCGDVE